MGLVICKSCYKGTILVYNRIIGVTLKWSFSYKFFVKFHVKKIGSHKMTVFYPNLRHNEVCYKRIALYNVFTEKIDVQPFNSL